MQPVLLPGLGLILPPQLMETELLKHPSLHVQNRGLSDGLGSLTSRVWACRPPRRGPCPDDSEYHGGFWALRGLNGVLGRRPL